MFEVRARESRAIRRMSGRRCSSAPPSRPAPALSPDEPEEGAVRPLQVDVQAPALLPSASLQHPVAAPGADQSEQTSSPPAHNAFAAIVTIEVASPHPADDDNNAHDLAILSGRYSISDARSRVLYERYGLKIEAREHSDRLPRVEKSVRMRVHWTCHRCENLFRGHKTCRTCGHRRCRSCLRSPDKRAKDILQSIRAEQEQELRRRQAMSILEVDERAGLASPLAEADSNTVATSQHPGSSSAASEAAALIELDPDAIGPEFDDRPYRYVLEARPNRTTDLVLQSRGSVIRRTCHECRTPFPPSGSPECKSCSHLRCKQCPRDFQRNIRPVAVNPAAAASHANSAPWEPKTAPGVQRVYKKPRQRVRWTCDRCQLMFTDGRRCRNCGHERCHMCVRTPSRRVVPAAEPAVIHAIASRLAQVRGPSATPTRDRSDPIAVGLG